MGGGQVCLQGVAARVTTLIESDAFGERWLGQSSGGSSAEEEGEDGEGLHLERWCDGQGELSGVGEDQIQRHLSSRDTGNGPALYTFSRLARQLRIR
jgi:hypothetical protein